MPINESLLRITIMKQAEKVLVREVRPIVKLDFEAKKEKFLEAFDEDPVSQELSGGVDAFSQVPELAEVGGNLTSFLGFEPNKNPIGSLREYLNDNIVLYQTKAGRIVGNQIVFETQFVSPTETEIGQVVANDADTKLTWTDRPFTDVLDKGVPGLPQFLPKSLPNPPSRSGGGIQTKKNVSDVDMRPNHYIKRLLGVLARIVRPQS